MGSSARTATGVKSPSLTPDIDGKVDENTPLLINGEGVAVEVTEVTAPNGSQGPEDDDAPLPVFQIVLLCFARFIEPLAFFSIFPYINQMVQENGDLAEEDVGFYSGLIESLFSLTQGVVMIFWGKASDRFGRKPVLVASLLGLSIAIGTFGLAKSLWQMIMFRCFAGVFAGTIITIRTMISEHSTQKTQARAFSYFAFTGNLGIFLAPLLGGALADPVGQYPGAFGRNKLFKTYPYLLSSLVVGCVGLVSTLVTVMFVKETLKPEPPSASAEDGEDSNGATHKPGHMTIWQLVNAPGVGIVLYVYAHIMFLAFAYTAIASLFWFTSPALGGFGFTPLQISFMMGFSGLMQAIWLLFVFPPLQRRLTTNGVMNFCGYMYPCFFFFAPGLIMLLRNGSEAALIAFWIVMPVATAIGVGCSMGFTAIQLALNDISPSHHVLGTLNALALTLTSFIRAFTPALFTSLFAWGANTQWLDGYLIWAVLTVLAAGYTVAARFLPDPEEAKARMRDQERRRHGEREE